MDTDFLITPMRSLTLAAMTFFYVANQPTELTNLDRDLDVLLDRLYEAKALANIAEAGPDIVRYAQANPDAAPGQPALFWMEVGIAVKPDVQPVGTAQIKTLPPYPCAGLLLWGGLAHVGQSYETLTQAVSAAGLRRGGECRECHYFFEAPDSPHNLMGIYMEITP